MFRRKCNRLVTTRARSAACRFQFAGFCGSHVSNQPAAEPQHPLHGIQKACARVRAAGGGTTTSVTSACARGVREYIPHAFLAGDVLAVGSVSQLG